MTKVRRILNRMDNVESDVSERYHQTVVLDKDINGFTMDGKKVKVKKGHYSLVGKDEDRDKNVLISDSEYEIFSVSRKSARCELIWIKYETSEQRRQSSIFNRCLQNRPTH